MFIKKLTGFKVSKCEPNKQGNLKFIKYWEIKNCLMVS